MPPALRAPALALPIGCVHAACFSLGAAGAWLQCALLAALGALLAGATRPRDAAATGFAFAFATMATGVAWLFVSMHRYGGLPAPLAVAAVVLLAAYLGAFGALAAAAANRISGTPRAGEPGSTVAAVLAFAGAWCLGELARAYLFSGFPWLSVGYGQIDSPLATGARVVGVHGLGALIVLAGAGTGMALRVNRRPARALGGAIACWLPVLIVASLASTVRTAPAGRPLEVRLVQGNVPQAMKFDPTRSLDAMLAYTADIEGGSARLTVLPETAWVVPWSATPPHIVERIRAHLARSGEKLALGMPLQARAAAPGELPLPTNSVAVLDARGSMAARYDKRHLVPFGEFVPAGFGWFVRMMHIPLGEFGRGERAQPPVPVDDQRIAFNICYEDLFGPELAVQVRGGATLLVNTTNIAWFGDTHALPQHLNISRMRAIELGRPMLRATNTGVTAAIDRDGKVIARLDPYTRGVLAAKVQGAKGLTPYARHGDAIALGLGLALVLAAALLAGGRRRQSR